MQLSKIIQYLFITLLFVLNTSVSQVITHNDGKYSYQTVENDPLKTRIYQLNNGLTVYLTVLKNEPRIQTFIAVRAGSKNDPSDATGLAHYLEHMLFKGTDKFGTKNYEKEKPLLNEIMNLYSQYNKTTDKKERKLIYKKIDSVSVLASQYAIANEYDKMLSSIGAKGTNAYTSFEQTVYVNDIPSNQLDKWLTIEAERFRNPVMRLFHTELETVYEEKNISLDDDGSKVWETMLIELFPKHQYGTQTTIGTIEHLKNPPLKKVVEYLKTYYVPNNMAICLSGDFDPDQVIKLIDEKWGSMKPGNVETFVSVQEEPITKPVEKDVYGPNAEEVLIGYRFRGAISEDADMLTLINKILTNDKAGIIDNNLNQKQKVLEAGSFPMILKDYSTFFLYGYPREGQSLKDVARLLLEQIEDLKQGKFEDWLLNAIINNMKMEQIANYESNRSRAHAFVSSFIKGVPWEYQIKTIDRLSKMTKEDVIKFARENFKNNYVVIYKHTGEDKNVKKVEKPEITPVEVNRTEQSDFLKTVLELPVNETEPVFVDYKNDITFSALNEETPIYYIKNTENELFNISYVIDMGSNHNNRLGLAISYLEYLGTSKYTPEQLKQEFYKLACSFNVSNSQDQIFLSLNGINENFDKALNLFEEFLSDLKVNKDAFDNLIKDILKVRADNKLSKETILWQAAFNYAKYGSKSPYTNIILEGELYNIIPDQIVDMLKDLTSYKHKILYYGPMSLDDMTKSLKQYHKLPDEYKQIPEPVKYTEEEAVNTVYVVNYPDMVQAEIVFLSKKSFYNKELVPIISLYNEYFGNNMSGIVFQELRESKALAYAVFSSYSVTRNLRESNYLFAYIGTQADKLPEAMAGMMAILTDMPESEVTFSSAKNSLLNQIRTSRTIGDDILFGYLNAQKLGLDYDIKKDIYNNALNLTLQNVKKFQNEFVKDSKYTIIVLADKSKIDIQTLEKYGEVKYLNLEDIFGY